MLKVILLSVNIPNAEMVSVILLNVVAPKGKALVLSQKQKNVG
jgi:hypothetical protein